MNLSWANQFAKTALKNAQQKIDSVLDIQTNEEGAQVAIVDDPLLTPVPQDANFDHVLGDSPAVENEDGSSDQWTSSWANMVSEPELVVDSEPNPVRDEGNVETLLDHSPSSVGNSSDGLEPGHSPQKESPTENYEEVVLDDNPYEHIIQNEPVLPPNARSSRRSSHHDDSHTVASSDIEVIRNLDAWSIASSRTNNDNGALASKADCTLRAQIKHTEQRIRELKASNDAHQKSNAQLQQRIVQLNQLNTSLKKELEQKNVELDDLLKEGKKLSDHSGKQARELRRLKNEVGEMEKIKTEKKKLKDEKTQAEDIVSIQKEEISQLKEIIKTLESSSEQMKKENSLVTASTEVVQKHIDDQTRKLKDIETILSDRDVKITELEESNKVLVSEMESLRASQWAERVAGERATESAASSGAELEETRLHVDRLQLQLKDTQQQLETALNERSGIADMIARANAPLLEEIAELKARLTNEESSNETADGRFRDLSKQLLDANAQLKAADNKYAQYVAQCREDVEISRRRNTTLEKELERVRLEEKEKSTELRASIAAQSANIEAVLLEKTTLQNNFDTLRKNIKEFKQENDALKCELSELRKQKERSTSPHHFSQPDGVEETLPDPVVEPIHSGRPQSYMMSIPATAAQVELEMMSSQYESSMKRIAKLEGDASQSMILETKVRQLQREIKELNEQYNQLLEVDGERLERIEELTQDVLDLRQLLKDQSIAFAETQTEKSSTTKP